MKDKSIVVCVGILMIGTIVCIALYMGVDGVVLATGMTTIGSIIAYLFGQRSEPEKPSTTDENNP